MFKWKICLIMLLTVFLCSACTTEKTGQTPNNSKNASVNDASLTPDNSDNTANTYKITLADNLKVDATVDASNLKVIPTLQVTEKVFDKNKLINVFLGSTDIKEKKETGESTYTVNNKNLTIPEDPGRFNFITPLGNYVKSIIDNPDGVNNFKLKELDFMTKAKATEQVTAIFKTLNITPHISPKIYALDYNTLQQEQDNLMLDKDFKWFVNLGKTKVKEKWTKDDECYYMIFRIDMNDIPCYATGYTLQSSEFRVSGSEVSVIISKNGIESYSINGLIYNEKDSKINTSNLISMEQALDSLKEKYSNVILTDEMIVTDISMVYVPVIISSSTDSKTGALSNKQIEMVPCWYFNINQKYTKAGKVSTVAIEVIINAITGKEIF